MSACFFELPLIGSLRVFELKERLCLFCRYSLPLNIHRPKPSIWVKAPGSSSSCKPSISYPVKVRSYNSQQSLVFSMFSYRCACRGIPRHTWGLYSMILG